MDAEKGQFDTDFILNFISKGMGSIQHIQGISSLWHEFLMIW